MRGFPCLGSWPALWRAAGCLGLQSQTYSKIKNWAYAPGRGISFLLCTSSQKLSLQSSIPSTSGPTKCCSRSKVIPLFYSLILRISWPLIELICKNSGLVYTPQCLKIKTQLGPQHVRTYFLTCSTLTPKHLRMYIELVPQIWGISFHTHHLNRQYSRTYVEFDP